MSDIIFPEEWNELSAPGARYELMYRLREMVRDVSQFTDSNIYDKMIGHAHFFIDDYPFVDDLRLLEGVVIFPREYLDTEVFVEHFCIYWQSVETKKVEKVASSRLLASADFLYARLCESGDPQIAIS